MIAAINKWLDSLPERRLQKGTRVDENGVYYRVAEPEQFYKWSGHGYNVLTVQCISPLYWVGSRLFGRWKKATEVSYPFKTVSDLDQFAPVIKETT